MRTVRVRTCLLVCLAVSAVPAVAAGCGGSAGTVRSRPTPSFAVSQLPPPSPRLSVVPAAQVRANELGQIPVLMVHKVVPRPAGDYAQTPAQFRARLEYLARHGYVPVTAAQLTGSDLALPAGASPVVLTFDDGDPSHLRLRPDGSVDPRSAVGIMLAVAQRHPRFRPVGTMYVNRAPFGLADPRRELRWLVEHGWEIGNHTATHANLGALPAAAVQREIADGHRVITDALPGYPVTTMALPFGMMPARPALAHSGSAGGLTYHYRGVMLVGANPAPSPYAAGWDPHRIPRIRSWHGRTEADEHYWLPQLERTRYISDGDPAAVSFPREVAAGTPIASRFAARANPY